MKLREISIGMILKDLNRDLICHVIGLTQNSTNEAIPIVKNQDGKEYPLHHSHLKKLGD